MSYTTIKNESFVGVNNLKMIEDVEFRKHPALVEEYLYSLPLQSKHKLPKERPVRVLQFERDENGEIMLLLDYIEIPKINKTTGEMKVNEFELNLTITKVNVKAKSDRERFEDIVKRLCVLVDEAKGTRWGVAYRMAYFDRDTEMGILEVLFRYSEKPYNDVFRSVKRYGYKMGGFFKETSGWTQEAVLTVDVNKTKTRVFQLGINKTVQGSLQMFCYEEEGSMKKPDYVWITNISNFWDKSLNKTLKMFMKANQIEEQSVQMTAYKKDLKRYEAFQNYVGEFMKSYDWRLNVLRQNNPMVIEMINIISKQMALLVRLIESLYQAIFDSFGVHFKELYSSGQLADIGFGTILTNEENKSLNYHYQVEEWQTQGVDLKTIETATNMFANSYNAGFIEQLVIGNVIGKDEELSMSDINSSYPASMDVLQDLRYSTLRTIETPCSFDAAVKPDFQTFVWIDAEVIVPETIWANPLCTKETGKVQKMATKTGRSNIRSVGHFRTTGIYEEFEFLRQQGATIVKVYKQTIIETVGKVSPFKKFNDKMVELRGEAIAEENKMKEKIIKTGNNSGYGKTMQTMEQYEMDAQNNIEFKGHLAGRHFNIALASLICSYSRLRVLEMALEIEKNGGKIITIMTDSIYYTHTKTETAEKVQPKRFESILSHRKGVFTENGWDTDKKLGLFDKPKTYDFGFFLQIGHYEVRLKGENFYETKIMGVPIDEFLVVDEWLATFIVEKGLEVNVVDGQIATSEIPYLTFLVWKSQRNDELQMKTDGTYELIEIPTKHIVVPNEVLDGYYEMNELGKRSVMLQERDTRYLGTKRRYLEKITLEGLLKGKYDSVAINVSSRLSNAQGVMNKGKDFLDEEFQDVFNNNMLDVEKYYVQYQILTTRSANQVAKNKVKVPKEDKGPTIGKTALSKLYWTYAKNRGKEADLKLMGYKQRTIGNSAKGIPYSEMSFRDITAMHEDKYQIALYFENIMKMVELEPLIKNLEENKRLTISKLSQEVQDMLK